MEEKLICIYSGPIGGDCCSHKQYRPINPMTVRELCEYAISLKDEWGYIGIKDKSSVFGKPQIEYWHGTYCDRSRKPIELNFPKEILDSYIELIDWDGGWSRGDWLITLVGHKEEPEPIRKEPPTLTKEQKIESRIKSMSNEELERYILEAKARKLMKEER